jgi:CRP/FNR family cyclic AMP-dependent transcriptional regulator
VQLPQEQLALMLSLSRQTVNQVLKQFEAQGAVRLVRGGVEIVGLDKLRALAG